jgi:hypothetical protein
MGLAELQTALARLYTDDAWRAEFFRDPAHTGAQAGLTPQETAQLAAMSEKEVDFFARTLHNKRLNEIHKLLPHTRHALGPAFDAAFRAYAPAYQPDGTKKHRDDALAFVAYLAQTQADAPAWASDVLRYEAARLLSLQPGRILLARRFRHALKPLLAGLSQAETAPAVVPRLNFAVWLRPATDAPLRHWLWR